MKKKNTLFDKLTATPHLKKSWHAINKQNKNSYGLDGVTISAFQANLNDHIKSIRKDLLSGKYKFHKLRGCLIPKNDKEKRPLRILTIRDRVVQKAMLLLMGRSFHNFDLPCSFGYQEGVSRDKAVTEMKKLRDEGYWYVLEADIIKFFDNVDRDVLLNNVFSVLQDNSLNSFIKESLEIEVGNHDEFKCEPIVYFDDGEIGIPQGGLLSPLFANFYLSPFDKLMTEGNFKLIRYADDFVVLTKSETEAHRACQIAVKYLQETLKLTLHPLGSDKKSKTRITNFAEGFEFLGFQFNQNTVLPSEKSRDKFREKINEITNPTKWNKGKFNSLIKAINILNNRVLGWGNAYRICKNRDSIEMLRICESLDGYVREKVSYLLQECGFKCTESKMRGFHYKMLDTPSLLFLFKDA
jgi:RNA-directed DNA polymerase